MDVRARRPQRRRSEAVLRDIARVERIWSDTRSRFGSRGDLLFGTFTIADAFYAPVAFRFRTYGVKPTGVSGEYLAALLALPGMEGVGGGRRGTTSGSSTTTSTCSTRTTDGSSGSAAIGRVPPHREEELAVGLSTVAGVAAAAFQPRHHRAEVHPARILVRASPITA